ncbi:MAG: hypothetical protein ACLUOI_32745 [Eisenbergiella sp.]
MPVEGTVTFEMKQCGKDDIHESYRRYLVGNRQGRQKQRRLYSRGCYSPAYFDSLDIVERQMEELGMEVSRDAAGNILGVLPGKDKKLGSIIMGSHLIRFLPADCLTEHMALPEDSR